MGSCRILGIRTGPGFNPCINAILKLGVAGEPWGCSKSCRILGISRMEYDSSLCCPKFVDRAFKVSSVSAAMDVDGNLRGAEF